MRRAIRRRDFALDLDPSVGSTPLMPTASLAQNPEEVGERLRYWLKVEPSQVNQWRTNSFALTGWIRELASLGILVFQTSGAHTVEIEEMRGFSIAEFPLPIIVLNGRDAPAGRVFTLFHELTHLMSESRNGSR